MKQETSIQTMRVRYVKPSVLLSRLEKQPDGIEQILPDDKEMRLTVRGKRADVDSFAQLVKLLDVRPQRFVIELLLIRYGPTGKRERVLERTVQPIENHTKETLALGKNYSVELTPHSHPKGIKIDATVRPTAPPNTTPSTKEPPRPLSEVSGRVVGLGKSLLLANMLQSGPQAGILTIELIATPEK